MMAECVLLVYENKYLTILISMKRLSKNSMGFFIEIALLVMHIIM